MTSEIFNVRLKEYKPKEQYRFYCQLCDDNVVNSENKETGSFFVVSGHGWDPKTKAYDGDYNLLMFARCKNCCTKVS